MSDLEIKLVTYQGDREAIISIRRRVFEEEQKVPREIEFDGKDDDDTAEHFLAYWQGRAVGTARLRFLDPQTAKIERLAVLPEARGKKIATGLMEAVLERIVQRGGKQAIAHAQAYIRELYSQLGFESEGEGFEEAGIPHLKMIKRL